MAANGKSLGSLRFNRFDIERMSFVLAFSLAAHLVAYGGYEVGRTYHLLPAWHLFGKKPQPVPVAQNPEQPVEFAMVQNPSSEAPKNAKYYGAQNSVASDNSQKNLNQPELNGKQTDVPDLDTARKEDFNQLHPQQPSPKMDSSQAVEPGDLILDNPKLEQPQTRPRNLQQAMAQKHLPGFQMKQNGGVPRFELVPSVDVKASMFGVYDEAFVEAVRQRWYDLLGNQNFALDRTGKVVVQFHLNYDGSISDMTILQNNVGELLGTVCEDAIHDPAPYAQWSEEMRHQIGQTYRKVTFTFFY
jgi:hypothetical protein